MSEIPRMTVSPNEGFVVFLIGMRVNRLWLAPVWWGVTLAMKRMLDQLAGDPSSGLLRSEAWFGRTTILVQYWRSVEQLHAYAHAKERAHVPAWRAWAQGWGETGAVGIWHETYVVGPGQYEAVYAHMPPFGLSAAFPRIPAAGPLATASGRLAAAAKVA